MANKFFDIFWGKEIDPVKPGGIQPFEIEEEEVKIPETEPTKIPEIRPEVPKPEEESYVPPLTQEITEEEFYTPPLTRETTLEKPEDVYIPEVKPPVAEIPTPETPTPESPLEEQNKFFKDALTDLDIKIKDAKQRQPLYAKFLGTIFESTELKNLEKAKRLLKDAFEERAGFGDAAWDFFEAVEEGVFRGDLTAGFRTIRQTGEQIQYARFAEKLKKGLPLDETDKSFQTLMEIQMLHKERTGDNFYDQYILSTAEGLPNVAAFITEFALAGYVLKKVMFGVQTAVLGRLASTVKPGSKMIELYPWAKKSMFIKDIPAQIAASISSAAVHAGAGGILTMGPVLAERLLPDYKFDINEEGKLIAELDRKGLPIWKALSQAIGIQMSEWMIERIGFVVDDPISWLKRATLRKVTVKHGLNIVLSAREFFTKIGFSWSGLIGQTLEERAQHYTRNIITGEELKSPFSKEELDNTLREFLGVSMVAAAGASVNASARLSTRITKKAEETLLTLDPNRSLLITLNSHIEITQRKVERGEISKEEGERIIREAEKRKDNIIEMSEKSKGPKKSETIIDNFVAKEQEAIDKGEMTPEQIDDVNKEFGFATRAQYIEAAQDISESIETPEEKTKALVVLSEAKADTNNVSKAYNAYKTAVQTKEKEEQLEFESVTKTELEERELSFFDKLKIEKGEKYHERTRELYDKLMNNVNEELGRSRVHRNISERPEFKELLNSGLIMYDKESGYIESPFILKKTKFTEEEIERLNKKEDLDRALITIKRNFLEPNRISISKEDTKRFLETDLKIIQALIDRGDLIYDKKSKKLSLTERLSTKDLKEIRKEISEEETKEFREKITPTKFETMEEVLEEEVTPGEVLEITERITEKEPAISTGELILKPREEGPRVLPGIQITDPASVINEFEGNTYESFVKRLKEKYKYTGLHESQVENFVYSYFNFFNLKEGKISLTRDVNNKTRYWFLPRQLFRNPSLNELEMAETEEGISKIYGEVMNLYSILRSQKLGFDIEVIINKDIDAVFPIETDIEKEYDKMLNDLFGQLDFQDKQDILQGLGFTIAIEGNQWTPTLDLTLEEQKEIWKNLKREEKIEVLKKFGFYDLKEVGFEEYIPERKKEITIPEGTTGTIIGLTDVGQYIVVSPNIEEMKHPLVFLMNPEDGKYFFTGNMLTNIREFEEIALTKKELAELKYNINKPALDKIWHVIEHVAQYNRKDSLILEEAQRRLKIINKEIESYNKKEVSDARIKPLTFLEAFKTIRPRPAKFSDMTGYTIASRIYVPVDYLEGYKKEFETNNSALSEFGGFEGIVNKVAEDLAREGTVIPLKPENMKHPIVMNIGKKAMKRGKTKIIPSPQTIEELLGYEDVEKTSVLNFLIEDKLITIRDLFKRHGGELALQTYKLSGKIRSIENKIEIETESLKVAHKNFSTNHYSYMNSTPIVVKESETSEIAGIKQYEIKDEASYIRYIAYTRFLADIRGSLVSNFEETSSLRDRISGLGNDAWVPIAVSTADNLLKGKEVSEIGISTKLNYLNYMSKLDGTYSPTVIQQLKKALSREPGKSRFGFKKNIQNETDKIRNITFGRVKSNLQNFYREVLKRKRIIKILKRYDAESLKKEISFLVNKNEIDRSRRLKALEETLKNREGAIKKEAHKEKRDRIYEEIDSIKDTIADIKNRIKILENFELDTARKNLEIIENENISDNESRIGELEKNIENYKDFIKKTKESGILTVVIEKNKITHIDKNNKKQTKDLDEKSIEIYNDAIKESEDLMKTELENSEKEFAELPQKIKETEENKNIASKYGDLLDNAAYQQAQEELGRLNDKQKQLKQYISLLKAVLKDGIEYTSNLIKVLGQNEDLVYYRRTRNLLAPKRREAMEMELDFETLKNILVTLGAPHNLVIEALEKKRKELEQAKLEALPLEKRNEKIKELEKTIRDLEKETQKEEIENGKRKVEVEKTLEQINELLDVQSDIIGGNITDISDADITKETREIVESLYSPSEETKRQIKESEKIPEEQKEEMNKKGFVEKINSEQSRIKSEKTEEDNPGLEKRIDNLGKDNGGTIDTNELDKVFNEFKDMPENLSWYMKGVLKWVAPYVNKIHIFGYKALEEFYFPLMNADIKIRQELNKATQYFNKHLPDDLKLTEEYSFIGAIKAIADKLKVDSNLLFNIIPDGDKGGENRIKETARDKTIITLSDLNNKPELANLKRLYYVAQSVYYDITDRYNEGRIKSGKVNIKKDGSYSGVISRDPDHMMEHLSFMSRKGWAYMINGSIQSINEAYKKHLQFLNLERTLKETEARYNIDKSARAVEDIWSVIEFAAQYDRNDKLTRDEVLEKLENINKHIIEYNKEADTPLDLLTFEEAIREVKAEVVETKWEWEPKEEAEYKDKVNKLRKYFNKKGFDGSILIGQVMEGLLYGENHAPVLREMRYKANYKGMLAQKNPILYRSITDQINFLEGKRSGVIFKDTSEERWLNWAANYLRHSAVLVLIAGSLSVVMVQPYSLANTIGELGPTSLLRGFLKSFSAISKRYFGWTFGKMDAKEKTQEEIWMNGMDGVLGERLNIYDYDAFKTFYGSISWGDGYFGQRFLRKATALRDKLADSVMKRTIQYMDSAMANITYRSAMEHAFAGKAEGIVAMSKIDLNNEKERQEYVRKVTEFASVVTERTQASGAKRNTARLRQTPIEAALTSIQTFIFSQFTLMMEKIQTIERSVRGKKLPKGLGGDDRLKAMFGSFLFFLWFSIYTGILNYLYGKTGLPITVPRPIKEGRRAYRAYKDGTGEFIDIFKEPAGEFLEMVPIGSTFKYEKNVLIVQFIQDSYTILSKTIQGEELPYDIEPEKTIAMLIKFPIANQIVKSLRGIVAVEKGYKVPNEELRIEIRESMDIATAILFGGYWTKAVQDYLDREDDSYENLFRNLTPPQELNFMDNEMRKEYFRKKTWAAEDFWKTFIWGPDEWFEKMKKSEHEKAFGLTPEQEKKKKLEVSTEETKRKMEEGLLRGRGVEDIDLESWEETQKYIRK